MLLPQFFYNRATLKVAQDLLGCFLIRKFSGGEIIKTMIVETEAYNGPRDLASHASRGRTARNSIMFGPPGIIYVYFTYGMHYMLNVVTGTENYPAAVLIRAVSPVADLRWPISGLRFDGPARLTKALKIDKAFNGLPIYVKKYRLWIDGRDKDSKPPPIVKTARVGVDYAREYRDKKWRFYIKGNKFVSRK